MDLRILPGLGVLVLLSRAAAPWLPGPVPLMLAVLILRWTVQAPQPRVGERIDALLRPGAAWLLRWMPIFFVPSVVGAADLEVPDLGLLLRVLAVLLLGWLMVLAATSWIAGRVGRGAADDLPETPHVHVLPTPRTLLLLWSAAIGGLLLLRNLPLPGLAHGTVLAAILAGYLTGQRLPPAWRRVLHPLLLASAAALACLRLGPVPLPAWSLVRDGLTALLAASVTGLAWPLYDKRDWLRGHAVLIAATLLPAALLSVLGTAVLARLLALPPAWSWPLLVRSVTSSVAIPLAQRLHASLPLAASSVVFTGMLGAWAGRALLDLLRVRSPLARGLAMGASAHALGTASLTAAEPAAAAVSALALALHAALVALLIEVPGVLELLRGVLG